MAQDIRELLKRDQGFSSAKMKEGHEARFLQRLEAALPVRKRATSYAWLKIAASIVVVLSIAGLFIPNAIQDIAPIVAVDAEVETTKLEKQSALAGISPEFKKVEDYYISSIKLELSTLTINATNKELIDNFMHQLAQLDLEYETLNTELMEVGANEQTVQALIDNLQLRLDLMMKLKSKLNTLKRIADETYQDQQA